MSITVTVEEKEHRQLGLIIEVGEERFQSEMRKAARKVANQYRIPGFRKGKAPYNIILRHFGVGALVEEFVDDLGQEVYKSALEQEGIEPYAIGSMENVELDPLRYHVTVPLAPEVKLGDYRSVRVEEEEVEVDEADVEARIDQILEREAGYAEVERPSEYGDLMNVDVRAVVLDEEGNETDTVVMDETDWDLTPDGENPMEPEGFDAALLGMVPGDEKSFEIDWPEGSPSMYAGKRVRFHVKLHANQAYVTPELTDELAQSVGPDFETAEDLTDSIREAIREERAAEAKEAFMEAVMNELVEMAEIDYPPAAVEMQIDQMLQTMDFRFRQMGLQGVDGYLEMSGQTLEEYRETLREEAEQILRRNLILSEIAVVEKVTVEEEEIDAEISEMFGELDEDASEEEIESRQSLLQMMKEGPGSLSIVERIATEKTIDLIEAIARGEDVPLPPEDDEEAEAEAVTDGDDSPEAEAQATDNQESGSEAEAEDQTGSDSEDAAQDAPVLEAASEEPKAQVEG